MKWTMIVALFLMNSAFAANNLHCSVIASHQEYEATLLDKTVTLDDSTGVTYLEVGTVRDVTFNATAVREKFILLYAKINGTSVMTQVEKEGKLDVFFADFSPPVTLSCRFR